jgi:ferrous iron transport protein A
MANTALSFDAEIAPRPRAKSLTIERDLSLALVLPGTCVHIDALAIEADMAAWLEAVGIGVGETLTVLRRAAFGGPIHVRTSAGGEFAIARSLAEAIGVRRENP